MKRLLLMLAWQLLIPSIAGAFLGALVFAAMSWTTTKAVLLGVMPLLLVVGTVVGYVRGRPTGSRANDPPGTRAVRGLLGSLVGMVVFSNVGMALGALTLYGYGLVGNVDWVTAFENWLPMIGTAGGGVGLVAGYVIAH